MPNFIHFIEQIGRNPAGRSAAIYTEAVESSELSPLEHRALLDHDPKALRDLLGARERALCMIATPDGGD